MARMAEIRPGRPRKWASNAERMRAYRAVERERREALRGQHDIAEMANASSRSRPSEIGCGNRSCASNSASPNLRTRSAGHPHGCHFLDVIAPASGGAPARVVTCRTSTRSNADAKQRRRCHGNRAVRTRAPSTRPGSSVTLPRPTSTRVVDPVWSSVTSQPDSQSP